MTRTTLFRMASVAGIVVTLAAACLWLLRRPPEDVIPTQFRGIWLDRGAECQDSSAQVRITGSTISYDRLSFKADGVAESRGDAVSLTGIAYPDGRAERETVELRMRDRRASLFIVAHELPGGGPFVRCVPDTE